MLDYGLTLSKIPILCDNTSAINLTKNHDARIKHIEIYYNFIRDHVSKGDIYLEYVCTENQLADIFTKPLDRERFCAIRNELGMMEINW